MNIQSPMRFGLAVVTTFGLATVDAGSAQATSYVVKTKDMTVRNDDKCGLVEALYAINQRVPFPSSADPECPAGGAGPDVITFDAALDRVPLVATRTLDILRPVTIKGRGIGTTIVRANLGGLASALFSITSASHGAMDVVIQDMTIDRQSTSTPQTSGLWAAGSGEVGAVNIELDRVRIAGHTRGGVYSEGATVRINDSTIEGNSSPDSGGGVGVWTDGGGYGQLWISHSTINGNTTGGDGGGIYWSVTGIAHLDDSTVSGNSSSYGGAGVTVNPAAGDGYLAINGSTIAFNNGVGINSPGDPSRFICRLSIIAKNTGLNWVGNVQELTDSLIGPNAGSLTVSGLNVHNLSSADPRLDASLVDSGGNHVKTHALQTGSPAIDYATSSAANEGDARRLPRGVEGDGRAGSARFDIGAHERQRP